jgi:hypothetical protein
MQHPIRYFGFGDTLERFLPAEVWKRAHQAHRPLREPSRWRLTAVVWVLLGCAWCTGDSLEERFAASRAVFVACHQHDRRPGETFAGFLDALRRLPMPVLRALAAGVRGQIRALFGGLLRVNGWMVFACDGSRLECPRSEELQARLGEAGKPGSAPSVYLSTLVLLPCAMLWAWQLGKGTASELDHLCRMLPTLPDRSLIVADAFYMGYDLFRSITQKPVSASFLVRLSSRAYLYTDESLPLERFREGLVWYWPGKAQDAGLPPLRVRLLRIRGKKVDVWLLTNVLDRQELSHKLARQIYRWRWRNEGLFRLYKRQLNKMKLQSRTVALVHREAEGSLLALQLLLAMAARVSQGEQAEIVMESPRRVLLRIRGMGESLRRTLGPRQFAHYLRMLEQVRTGERPGRKSSKVRQEWPRRSDHKPPKPPKLRVLTAELKAKMRKVLQAA